MSNLNVETLRPGDEICGFRISEVLGGRTPNVYKATDESRREVALKFLSTGAGLEARIGSGRKPKSAKAFAIGLL